MGDLTARIIQTATAPPTDDALAVMRLSLLDWIACGLAGRQEPVAGIVAGMLDAEGGVGTATGFDGVTRTARATALYNGTVSHALDYDDTHFAHIGHVSVGVLPNQQDPRTGLAAKFSYRAVMAFSLRDHTTAALETFDDHLVNQDDVRALMSKVTVAADAALSEMQAEVTITLRDATACKAASDLDAPQPIAVRQRRVNAKAEALIGAETVSACVSRIADDAAPVRALTALWNA